MKAMDKLGRRNPWRPAWLKARSSGVVRAGRAVIVNLLLERAKRQPKPPVRIPDNAA